MKRQLSRLGEQQDELLELRIASRIDDDRFGKKQAELLEREACLREQIEACGQDRAKNADVAAKAADVFQLILDKWPSADSASNGASWRLSSPVSFSSATS